MLKRPLRGTPEWVNDCWDHMAGWTRGLETAKLLTQIRGCTTPFLAGKVMGVSKQRISQLMRDGQLPWVMIEGKRMIPWVDLVECVMQQFHCGQRSYFPVAFATELTKDKALTSARAKSP